MGSSPLLMHSYAEEPHMMQFPLREPSVALHPDSLATSAT